MKQLVILSGKGGTGKTSVAAAFAHLAAEGQHPIRAVLADADVDASNLELVLGPTTLETHDFMGGGLAVIDTEACEGCGTCVEVCRFGAISLAEADECAPSVDPIACDGCAACAKVCPVEAITGEKDQLHFINIETCVKCGTCLEVCAKDAVVVLSGGTE